MKVRFCWWIKTVWLLHAVTVLPKVCSADPKGSATSSQEIYGYISVTATLKMTYILIEGIALFLNNRGTSLIGDGYFIWLLEYLIKKPPVPMMQVKISLGKSGQCIVTLVLVCIQSYLKLILRCKYISLDTYHLDTLYLYKQVREDL